MGFLKKIEFFFKIDKGGKFAVAYQMVLFHKNVFSALLRFFWQKSENFESWKS